MLTSSTTPPPPSQHPMDRNTSASKQTSLEAALSVRANAEETRRQMEALLDWEKDIKSKPASVSSTVSAPVRGAVQPPLAPSSSSPSSSSKHGVAESQQQMMERRLEQALLHKEKGNAYFKKAEYEKACNSYSRSLSAYGHQENALEPLPAHVKEGLVTVLNNRAMTRIKLGQHALAEADCTGVLALDAKNVKALWRRGVARREVGSNLKGAMEDLERAKVLEPGNKAVREELGRVEVLMTESQKPVRRRVEVMEVGDASMYKGAGTKSTNLLDVSPGINSTTGTADSSIWITSTSSNASAKPIIETINVPAASKPTPTIVSASVPTKQTIAPPDKRVQVQPPSTAFPAPASNTASPGLAAKKSMLHIIESTETPAPAKEPTLPTAVPAPLSVRKPLIMDLDPVTAPSVVKPVSAPTVDVLAPRTATPVPAAGAAPLVPPATLYEFEVQWKQRRGDVPALYALIKSIPPAKYRALFKNSMEAGYLSMFVYVLRESYVANETPRLLFDTLDGLARVDRFAMNVKFLGGKDKMVLRELFDHLRAAPKQELVDADVEGLEGKFGVKRL
ncbi:hypothetical protein BC830DRAFT_1141737 [Chytriomyces sp. MP71]|nr:hypothetical protein BC830DRAFT_1141737 [Chytriomyces sp. MP71]